MPFDPEFDAIFITLIKPAIEEAGYEVNRADTNLNQENILKDIVRGIANANLIIADLTSLNANVFYELGISHTLDIPTILLSQSIEGLPFDLLSYRVIKYSTHFKDAPQLAQTLKEMGEKAKCGNLIFGNPVTDFLPQNTNKIAFSSKKGDISAVEMNQNKDDSDDERKEVLDYVVDTQKSIEDLNECMSEISNATLDVGVSFREGTADLERIKNIKTPDKVMRLHKNATDVAAKMIIFAQTIEKEQPKFHSAWLSFNENTSGLIKCSRIVSIQDKEGAIMFRSTLNQIRSGVQSNLDAIQRYKITLEKMKGISKDINRASKRTIYSLDLLISDLEGADSFCVRSLTLLNEKIAREGQKMLN
jgi:hypothetical protein